jgi:hypothetical protein
MAGINIYAEILKRTDRETTYPLAVEMLKECWGGQLSTIKYCTTLKNLLQLVDDAVAWAPHYHAAEKLYAAALKCVDDTDEDETAYHVYMDLAEDEYGEAAPYYRSIRDLCEYIEDNYNGRIHDPLIKKKRPKYQGG